MYDIINDKDLTDATNKEFVDHITTHENILIVGECKSIVVKNTVEDIS